MTTPGERLQIARKFAKFASASAAAKRHRWPVSTYLSHENGQTPEIPHGAARKYAKAFGVSAAWLLNEEGDMVPTISKDQLQKLVESIPIDKRPIAIEMLTVLAATGRKPR